MNDEALIRSFLKKNKKKSPKGKGSERKGGKRMVKIRKTEVVT